MIFQPSQRSQPKPAAFGDGAAETKSHNFPAPGEDGMPLNQIRRDPCLPWVLLGKVYLLPTVSGAQTSFTAHTRAYA